jgi:hypothetical protein
MLPDDIQVWMKIHALCHVEIDIEYRSDEIGKHMLSYHQPNINEKRTHDKQLEGPGKKPI